MLGVFAAATERARTNSEWRHYGADQAGTKYAPLNQIHGGNVENLRVAWRWESIDEPLLAEPDIWTRKYEATPIIVGDVLYGGEPRNNTIVLPF